ncbi:hypothetical protein GEMRC1_003525 [Eukaryota sp. GEM-RC1]
MLLRKNPLIPWISQHHVLSAFLFIILFSLFKLLLAPAYFSTDFEVHRNWLAVTHSLPLDEWYVDSTSPWTLDYPPLFAFFEKFLSFFANAVDPKIVSISNLNYASQSCVLFQRISVILSDFFFYFSLWFFLKTICKNDLSLFLSFAITSSFPALLFIDHVHFQYNGFLMSWFLWSFTFLIKGKLELSAFYFAVSIGFKHIFIFFALPFFLILLVRTLYSHQSKLIILVNLFKVFTAGALPLLLVSRLFPFQRGLIHSYPAPNFWVMYTSFDLLLSRLRENSSTLLTSGLTFTSTSVLPNPPSWLCLLLSLLPCLVHVCRIKRRTLQKSTVISFVLISGLCFFFFGYHVHEKALLMITIPMIPLFFSSRSHLLSNCALIMTSITCVAVIPLFSDFKRLC